MSPEQFAQYRRASQLNELNRHADAEAAFKELLASDPENDSALFELSIAQFNQDGREKIALQTIERAIACEPGESAYHAYRSLILSNLDRSKEAIAAAEQAISLDPDSAFGFRAKAQALLQTGSTPEAEVAARQALACDPEDAGAANLLSHALRIQGKTAENAEQIAAMLARDPEDDGNHTAAGWQALQRGEREAAERHFREALRINAQSELAREGLLESFKARSPLYRGYQKWVYWMASQSQARQWAVIIGFLFLNRIFRSLSGTEYALLGAVGVGLYWLVVLWMHVASGVGNLFVLCDRSARLALKKRERIEAIIVGGGVVAGLALVALGVTGNQLLPGDAKLLMVPIFILGGTLVVSALPFAHTFTNDAPVGRWVMGLSGLFVFLVGMMALVCLFLPGSALKGLATSLVFPALLVVFLATLLSNFRFFKR